MVGYQLFWACFTDVFVLSPLNDYNMSNITIMFNSSGVGVQVECMYGLMHVRAAAPYSMFVSGQATFDKLGKVKAV